MISSVLFALLFVGASIAAQETATVVCVAGQCLQGYTNLTLGASLSAPGAVTNILLLPGQYTATTNPQVLHNVLTASGASLNPSPGFSSSLSLPLNLALEPGLVIYANSLYGGQASYAPLPSSPAGNSSTSISAGSIALSSNVWTSIVSGSSSRIVLWNSVPDVSQLPSSLASNSLGIIDVQSDGCSPPCSGNGVCSTSRTCTCPSGFTGSSCESCAAGFFGPKCQPCPAGCTKCDEGISGSGRCLSQTVTNPSSACNCLNGVCQANRQCACNSGWTTASNGTACAQCAPGFFLTATGDFCQLGCTQCADGSGICITCQSGFTQNANDRTQCIAPTSTTSSGSPCPFGSFGTGTTCTQCSSACKTCSGPTSNDCIICASGTYKLNGTCVSTNANGVCANSNMIADNNKQECDSCPTKCTTCGIPNFNVASIVSQLQCTGCLPGSVLSGGQCVSNCPTGTFLSPQDNLTCTACSSTCSTCAGASNFCLTCANNQLASSGSCVSTCPSNTFSSSGSCIPCHPDCATCSGASFNQCSSCSSNRPVLTNGRCLPTCSQSQFFDTATSACQSCDSSCSSCAGAGPGQCLACSDSTQVLRGGSCVSAQCLNSTSVVPGLGVCLSDLVRLTSTSTSGPLPSITGLTNPVVTSSGSNRLTWWEILLMALGCAFIFMVFLMCWRKKARKQRAKETQQFAKAKLIEGNDWKARLMRFGERLFRHPKRTTTSPPEYMNAFGMRDVEAQKYYGNFDTKSKNKTKDSTKNSDLDLIINDYDYKRSEHSPVSEYSRYYGRQPHVHELDESVTTGSIYSQVTGRRDNTIPQPRQPVKGGLLARLSMSTASSRSVRREQLPELVSPAPPFSSATTVVATYPPTLAQEYKAAMQQRDSDLWWKVEPDQTGSSEGSKNPFRAGRF